MLWWLLVVAAHTSIGAAAATWVVRRRMERQLAAMRDRRARDAVGHSVEVAHLRNGRARYLAEALVVQAAVAVVDTAARDNHL